MDEAYKVWRKNTVWENPQLMKVSDPARYWEFTEEEVISIAREENEGALTNEDADDDDEIIPPIKSTNVLMPR